jgi:hypothetical protein
MTAESMRRSQSAATKTPARTSQTFHAIVQRKNFAEISPLAEIPHKPARTGLVKVAQDWPYQGEIVDIDRA